MTATPPTSAAVEQAGTPRSTAQALITRERQYQRRGRWAWRWIYYVNGDHGTDTLISAKGIARRLYGGFELDWEKSR